MLLAWLMTVVLISFRVNFKTFAPRVCIKSRFVANCGNTCQLPWLKMDGWQEEWMDVWMDGWMNGWMDGWMDGWMEERG